MSVRITDLPEATELNGSELIPIVQNGVTRRTTLDLANQVAIQNALNLKVSKDSDTGAASLPAGTTAQRPAGAMGKLRFNSTLNQFEGHNGSDWYRHYTQGNILGTVSQSGGVPTGAVVERGSNANGEYVRFADGTQICHRVNISMGNFVLGTTLYYSDEVTWTFPASFLDKPRTVLGSDSGSTRFFGVGTCHSATESFIVLTADAAYSDRIGYFTAIGRWF